MRIFAPIQMNAIAPSELILTPLNKVYHLDVLGEQIADDVILVGDPARVAMISEKFDRIESRSSHREFITHTGYYKSKRITVLSSGIGPDNIDIVMNELDAAINIDPLSRLPRDNKRSLNIYRLGTCGALRPELPVDSIVLSTHAIGLDGLLNFYKDLHTVNEAAISAEFIKHCNWPSNLAYPYCVAADENLQNKFTDLAHKGITVTAPGFYAPQGRRLRLDLALPELNDKLGTFEMNGLNILNFEMESSAIYGLGKLLGHRCLTLCVIIANRNRKEFSSNPAKSVQQLIDYSLNKISI